MKLNMAQIILLACGMDKFKILLGAANRGRSPHHTKKGPGRRHLQGKLKGNDDA